MKGICILTAVVFFVAAPLLLWSAEDGAALYESKCSMCHGSQGDGNPGGGIPALKETKLTAEKMISLLMKGEKDKTIHADPISDLNEAQAKAITDHIIKMKK